MLRKYIYLLRLHRLEQWGEGSRKEQKIILFVDAECLGCNSSVINYLRWWGWKPKSGLDSLEGTLCNHHHNKKAIGKGDLIRIYV